MQLMMVSHHKTEIKGAVFFPTKKSGTTLEDRLKENDPELNWILNDQEPVNKTFQK
jgi:hypothetical protein